MEIDFFEKKAVVKISLSELNLIFRQGGKDQK